MTSADNCLMRCEQCGSELTMSFAQGLRSGWPSCHGATMALKSTPPKMVMAAAIDGVMLERVATVEHARAAAELADTSDARCTCRGHGHPPHEPWCRSRDYRGPMCPACGGKLAPMHAARYDRLMATVRSQLQNETLMGFGCEKPECRAFVAVGRSWLAT